MVDKNGTIVNTYEYDEWGNIQISNETVSNPFKYAGEVYDEETRLYYLRARYYDPKFGRFITEDTYEGQIDDVLSLNGYSYCNNNPLIYSDPSGHAAVAIPIVEGGIIISGVYISYRYITSPGAREKVKQAAKDTATSINNDIKAAKKWVDKEVAKAKKKSADSSKNKSGNSSSQKDKEAGKNNGAGKTKIQPGAKTPRGREYTEHGAERANERGFDSKKVDDIIDNNKNNRVKEIDEDGKVTWRYQDKRGNTVITNEWGNKIVTVYSYPQSANGGKHIPKK